MTREENIQKTLVEKFPFLSGKVRIQRQRRIFADVPSQNFMEVFEYSVNSMKFPILCTITGLDEGENLGFLYHIATEDGVILNLKITVPKANPIIKTITNTFPPADIYEREVADLLGAKVEGLPEGMRYPLPDDWPAGEFPLRKDWKMKETRQDA